MLVACVGNIFRGDDGFGVEVARRLLQLDLPDHVTVADFGIRAVDLAFALEDDYDSVILVDATQQGGASGELYLMALDTTTDAGPEMDVHPLSHDLDPTAVLRMARAAKCRRLLLVGCEPETLGDEVRGLMGLSEAVEASVEVAIALLVRLFDEAPAIAPGTALAMPCGRTNGRI